MNEFVIYTKPNCSFCLKVKQLLTILELKYVEYILDRDFKIDEFKEKFPNAKTFPQVVLGDKTIGNSENLVEYLKENKFL